MFKCFDFKCNECDHVFEDYIETSKVEPIRCPKCNSLDVTRQFPFPRKIIVEGVTGLINP